MELISRCTPLLHNNNQELPATTQDSDDTLVILGAVPTFNKFVGFQKILLRFVNCLADCLNMETKMDGNNMETPKLAATSKIGRKAAKIRGLYASKVSSI